MTDAGAIDLEELNVRNGWIIESNIYQQGGTEVGPLTVQPLLSRILSIAGLHGFLRSVEIAQESISDDRSQIYHELFDWIWMTENWVRIVRIAVSDEQNKR